MRFTLVSWSLGQYTRKLKIHFRVAAKNCIKMLKTNQSVTFNFILGDLTEMS